MVMDDKSNEELIKYELDYKIIIENNALNNSFNYILNKGYKKIGIFIDGNVNDKNTIKIDGFIKQIKANKVLLYRVLPGEESKSIDTYFSIINYLEENNFDRKSLIVIIGGGVLGDLLGFIASTYMRGIDYINIPTTVLSMVDSSIGGKTAINSNRAKNIIGSFYNPSEVIMDIDFLNTLSDYEFTNGFGEVIKYAYILDNDLFSKLKIHGENLKKEKFKNNSISLKSYFLDNLDNKKDLLYIIKRCANLKAKIVVEDPKEKGIRKILNFGHTLGHSIEKILDYKLGHGYCVAMGMVLIEKVFNKLNKVEDGLISEMVEILTNYGLLGPIDIKDISKTDLNFNLINDKKSNNEYISLIYVNEIGKAVIEEVKKEDLKNILESI